ncbi:hypothetical protein IWX49DRAFT_549550 [Phyllosticta citricarpa]
MHGDQTGSVHGGAIRLKRTRWASSWPWYRRQRQLVFGDGGGERRSKGAARAEAGILHFRFGWCTASGPCCPMSTSKRLVCSAPRPLHVFPLFNSLHLLLLDRHDLLSRDLAVLAMFRDLYSRASLSPSAFLASNLCNSRVRAAPTFHRRFDPQPLSGYELISAESQGLFSPTIAVSFRSYKAYLSRDSGRSHGSALPLVDQRLYAFQPVGSTELPVSGLDAETQVISWTRRPSKHT